MVFVFKIINVTCNQYVTSLCIIMYLLNFVIVFIFCVTLPFECNWCSNPILALVLARSDAINRWQNLLGPQSLDEAMIAAPERLMNI